MHGSRRRVLVWGVAAVALVLIGNTTVRGQAQGPGERIREALAQLDANGDRIIERSEVPERGLPAFDRLLARGDANNDRKLEPEEIRGLLAKTQRLANAGATGERLRAMDRDGDGRVARDEFRGPPAIFDRLDRNQDGALTQDELPRPGGRPRPR